MLLKGLPLVLGLAAATTNSLHSQSEISRHGTITFQSTGNVTRATFNHPPINLVDSILLSDFQDFLTSLDPATRTTPPPKVVIFDSANPDFFLDHIDLNFLTAPIDSVKQAQIKQYDDVTRLLQNLTSTIFIAEINGAAFGAGQELSLQMDMRFAGPKARTGSIEDSVGLDAGGGGQLFLGTLINKGRARSIFLEPKPLMDQPVRL
jgi:enoyl-CoA hydratase/carnithine racemase